MGVNVSRTDHPHIPAKALNVSVQTLTRYAREGLIPFDVTPKGHRRYNTAEVIKTLRDAQESSVSLEPLNTAEGLIFGPPVEVSAQSRISQDLRSTHTLPYGETPADTCDDQTPGESAFDEMLNSAKKVVLVTW